ncbi:MAG: hypothetical protein ACR2PA_02230 [Hyphomicrobiaceae bacterium]
MLIKPNSTLVTLAISILGLLATMMPSIAGGADVVGVKVAKSGNAFRFDVTLKHADTGWKHYANKWEVVDPAGKVLGTRVLYHPHVDEQPFTRSLSGVKIPASVKMVTVRAYDSKHGGDGGKHMTIDVPH